MCVMNYEGRKRASARSDQYRHEHPAHTVLFVLTHFPITVSRSEKICPFVLETQINYQDLKSILLSSFLSEQLILKSTYFIVNHFDISHCIVDLIIYCYCLFLNLDFNGFINFFSFVFSPALVALLKTSILLLNHSSK